MRVQATNSENASPPPKAVVSQTASGSQDRATVILDALALRVHLLSLPQIAGIWWGNNKHPLAGARRFMDRLVESGLVARKILYAYPMIELSAPVVRWRPGDFEPDFGAVAYQLQSRWPDLPEQSIEVYTSTPRLANRMGGFNGRIQHRDQVTHDLHMSQLYLHYATSNLLAGRQWMGEELRKRGQEYGEKLPDAVLVDETGAQNCAVEFGGRYPKKRVRDFHDHCVTQRLAYELW